MTTMNRWGGVFVLATFILGLGKPLAETEAPAKPEADAPTAEAKQVALFKQFEKTLTNAEMTGQFTLVGKEVPPIKESYTIHSVKKMSQGDYWVFTARIKYGKKDITLPMPLQVKWRQQAGDLSGQRHHSRLGHVQFLHGDRWRQVFRHVAARRCRRPHVRHHHARQAQSTCPKSGVIWRIGWFGYPCRPWVETQVSRDQCGFTVLKDVRGALRVPSFLIEIERNQSAWPSGTHSI